LHVCFVSRFRKIAKRCMEEWKATYLFIVLGLMGLPEASEVVGPPTESAAANLLP